jgi:hypothetical protein
MIVGGCVCMVPGCLYCSSAGYLLPAECPGAITLYVPGTPAPERPDVSRRRVRMTSNEEV